MDLNIYAILIGLLVGALMGFTGLGGGVLLLPLLILGLGVSPLTAVGTGAAFSAVSKIGASVVHYRKGNVDLRLVGEMAVGSVPGALAGIWLLVWMRGRFGDGIDEVLSIVIGVLLIAIPILIVAESFLTTGGSSGINRTVSRWIPPSILAVIVGVIGGFLVGVSSVGAGSVVMMLLLLFFARAPATYVGTDIFHAVILTGVVGFAHYRLGTVDLSLAGSMLLGALPGVVIGSHFTGKLAQVWLRRVLLVVVFATGLIMLGKGLAW